MSTTVTSSAPKPLEAAAKPAQHAARAQDRKAEGDDMFANLLGLLASAQVLPEAATVSRAALGDSACGDTDPPQGTENPLAALIGWGLPVAADATLDKKTGAGGAEGHIGLPGAAWLADRTTATGAANASADAVSASGTIDITDMTPVEPTPLETAPKGAVALPANAVRPGAPQAFAARSADASTSGIAGAPWRHASLASTETLALQQTANQAPLARSTVALNERFGVAPGVPLANTDRREAAVEGFSPTTSAGGASRSPETATALPGASSGEGASGSDNAGSDASAFDQAEDPAHNPFAETNASEEPTVTHWGTQHLRHASLRVGGEAGEQAIDIQLSMQGQEVQVEFKTDSAEARASLREHAGESLADLLGKSGIQLGGVSVGAQGQRGSRGDDGAARQVGVRGVASANQTASSATQRPASTAPRADGSQPLDVFA